MASMPRYMAKEEGRKAVEATNMPQLPSRRRRVQRATGGPNFTSTALQRRTTNK